MRKLKQIVTCALSGILLMSQTIPINAESYTNNGNVSMLIRTQVASSWEVSIPSSVDFSVANKSAEYTINVSGDVADTSYLEVIPDNEVILMNDSGLSNITTTVTQNKNKWMGTELSETPVSTTGEITAPNDATFGAGIWQGQLNFQINCHEDTDLTPAKFDLIRSLDFYGAGDSVMEGYGNDYIGVLDTLSNTYAAAINKDYSISGSFLTNSGTNNTIGIQQQLGTALARIGTEGYTDKTVLVFDGGGNDMIAYGQGGSNITIQNMDSPDTDIAAAFSNCWGSITGMQTTHGVTAPVVFIIPKFTGEALNDTNTALQSVILSLETMASDNRLLIIDCNDILADSDIQDDNIHVKASGYTKISKAIVNALYDYYNP